MAEEQPPTPEQIMFARAVILTFQMWPALKHAVNEEWGGPESADKRDFLISHVCDLFMGGADPSKVPDIDDLAETLESYIIDEFECRLDDESADGVAEQILAMHKAIFVEGKGKEELEKLETAASRVKGLKIRAEQQEEEDTSSGEEDGEEEQGNNMDVDGNAQNQQGRTRQPRPEPEVDEEGFTTVPRRRR